MKKYLLIVFLIPVLYLFGCKNVAKYPMDPPSPDFVFDGVIGKWRVEEDTDKNNFIEVTKGRKDYRYHVIYWEKGGTNPTLETYVHFSKLNSDIFLNALCWDEYREKGYFQQAGYMFFKVVYMTPDFSKMAFTVVNDTTLGNLQSSLEVFNRVAKNLNNKAYYSDTTHLYKVQ